MKQKLSIFYLLNKKSKLNIEIVFVDDNSSDGTQDVIKEMQKKFGEDKIVYLINYEIS